MGIQLRTLIRGLGAHHSTYDTNRNYRPRYLVRRSVTDNFDSTSGLTSGLEPIVFCSIYRYEIIDNEKTAIKYRGRCDDDGRCVLGDLKTEDEKCFDLKSSTENPGSSFWSLKL